MIIQIYTKESLKKRLIEIINQGWIPNARHGNHGGIGNTLEDLLGIAENNLPIPNAAEWELKTQRLATTSLTTLFHVEPSPRAISFVPKILLPYYGWPYSEAGKKYSGGEMSFRQTIHGSNPSDRGFMVKIDREEKRVLISFDSSKVSPKHTEWLKSVSERVGLNELNPQPYWGFDDLEHKAGTKLLNCFYVQAREKTEDGLTFFKYEKVTMLQGLNFDGFLKAIEEAQILIDFDARSGHNHGTKFRLRQNQLPMLYEKVVVIV